MFSQWSIPLLFLILPFALIMPGLIWKSQQMFFIVCPLFIVAALIKNAWIRWFLIYAGVWQMGIFIYYFADPRGPGPGNGLSVILCLMAAGVIFKFVSEGTLSKETWYKVMRIAIIIQVAISIGQFLDYNFIAKFFGLFFPIKELLKEHMVGSLGNRNYLTSFIAMTLPMFIVWRKGIFLPAIAFMMIFCPSPASLAVIFGGVFYFAYTRWGTPKRILMMLPLSFLGTVVFTIIYVKTTGNHIWEFETLPKYLHEFFTTGTIKTDIFQGDLGRFAMWLTALSLMIKTIPGMILGFGPGAYWGRDYPLHSEYVATFFYFGLVGLFLVFGYIRQTWKFLWKSKDKILMTSFLIICIDCLANFPFEIATTAMMGLIILGLIERERINGQLSHV